MGGLSALGFCADLEPRALPWAGMMRAFGAQVRAAQEFGPTSQRRDVGYPTARPLATMQLEVNGSIPPGSLRICNSHPNICLPHFQRNLLTTKEYVSHECEGGCR